MRNKGLTLIELLIMIAIIGILAAVVAGFIERKNKSRNINHSYTEQTQSVTVPVTAQPQGLTILYNGKTYEGCREK